MANMIVGGLVLAVVALVIRHIWKSRKSGACGGDCGHCKGCH